MGGATTYDQFSVSVTGSTVTSIGSAVTTNASVSDTGGDTAVLGDVASDAFQVNATPGMTYVGTVTFDGGSGFIGTDGVNFFLFVPSGTTPPSGDVSLGITEPASFPPPGGVGEYNVVEGAVGCFRVGTMIATPDGERAVETLAGGDLVLTLGGTAKPVFWLGRSTVSRRFADPIRVLPIRVLAGALAENVPSRDLMVSPGHALLIDGVLVHAGSLVNGRSIVRDTDAPLVFDYYHVELATHEVLLADGAPAESFIEGNEDMAFGNWAERPEVAVRAEEMAYPRAKAPRQIPGAVRDKLAARAAAVVADRAAA